MAIVMQTLALTTRFSLLGMNTPIVLSVWEAGSDRFTVTSSHTLKTPIILRRSIALRIPRNLRWKRRSPWLYACTPIIGLWWKQVTSRRPTGWCSRPRCPSITSTDVQASRRGRRLCHSLPSAATA